MPRLIGNVIDVDGDASDGTQDENTSVTGLTDGRFVVSWGQREQVNGGNGFRTYYRVFAADGAPVTGERKIDSQYAPDATANSIVGDSTVTALPGGGFSIGFLDTTGFFGSPRVFGFKYWTATVTGPDYAETRSTLPQGNAQQGSLATLANGQAITAVTESNGGPAGNALVVGGQTLFSSAAAFGSPPGVARFGDGYVVVYAQRAAAPTGADVFGIIKATGFSDTPFLIHAATMGDQTTATFVRPVVALKDGGFVISWNDGVAAGGGASRLRVYGADGQPRTGEITLNALPGDGNFNPEVAPLDDGSFVVVFGTQLRHFLADGAPVGGAFTLPPNTAGNSNPLNSYSISSLGGSRVVFSFADSDARAQIIDIVNLVPGTEVGETLTGTATYDELTGLGGNDTLRGLGGDDVLLGGAGDDVLTGGLGINRLDGGDGVDTVDYSAEAGLVTISLSPDGAGLAGVGDGGTDHLVSVENVIGTAFDDNIGGDSAANVLQGLAGRDEMNGRFGADIISGGFGDDVLYGNQDDDVLYGNQDNDQLYGGQGNDAVYGGQGDDFVFGNLGDDRLFGNLGNDVLNGGAGINLLEGGDGVDTASYADAPSGVTVSLLLQGSNQATGVSTDFLTGIENLTGSVFPDMLTGDAGVNVVSGGSGNDEISGGFGADVLYGNLDGDTLYGNQDADVLYGGQASDALYGGQGDDVLWGGLGADAMYGNMGVDTFAYLSAADSTSAESDYIADFGSGTEKIDLRAVRRGAADTFAIEQIGGLAVLTVDLGGDGTTDMKINVLGVLAATDILFG